MTARAAASLNAPRVHSRSRLVFDAPGGRTRMSVSDLGAPLRVMRGFELDDGRLLVQVISAAPGLFAGDLYEVFSGEQRVIGQIQGRICIGWQQSVHIGG